MATRQKWGWASVVSLIALVGCECCGRNCDSCWGGGNSAPPVAARPMTSPGDAAATAGTGQKQSSPVMATSQTSGTAFTRTTIPSGGMTANPPATNVVPASNSQPVMVDLPPTTPASMPTAPASDTNLIPGPPASPPTLPGQR